MRLKHFLWIGFYLLLTLLPIANLAGILLTTGADTISNDYLLFVQQADRFLLGQNDWRQYFSDTLYTRVHSYAFLFPVRLALLKLTHLRVSAEIAAGFGLAAARVGLLYALLTLFLPTIGHPWRQHRHLWLLPALSALTFSLGQISTFSYGETALQFGFTQLATLAGLWLLFNHAHKSFSAWGAAVCGILASYSGGSGLMAWPVFLLAILWTDRRSLLKYANWLAGMLIAIWPYAAYSAFSPVSSPSSGFLPLRLEPLLIGIGLPFSNQINTGILEHEQALLLGISGIVLLSASIILLVRFRRHAMKLRAAPAIVLSLWGLLNAIQITVARQAIAPWYNTSTILFWIGIIGLAPIFLEPRLPVEKGDQPDNRWKHIYLPAWGTVVLAFILFLYVCANLSYEDKSFYLASRSPASAACLRSYQTAPTYCEGTVFQWGVGNPGYLQNAAFPLDRHNLSVFGPRQKWTLQGDYILGAVDWLWKPGLATPAFVRGAKDEPASWADYHHLNLLVPSGQTVSWQVTLPAEIHRARLALGISRHGKGKCANEAPGGVFEIAIYEPGSGKTVMSEAIDACQLAGRETVEIDLTAFAGKHIQVQFANRQAWDQNQSIRLHYPHIVMDGVVGDPILTGMPPILPANTELSLTSRPVDESTIRYLLGMDAQGLLHHLELQADEQRFTVTGADPLVSRATDTPICLFDRSHFYAKMALPDTFRRKNLAVNFAFIDDNGPGGTRSFDLPLLSGDDFHTYTLNLDLLNLPASACITEFSLRVQAPANQPVGDWFGLEEAGFLARQPD